MFPADSSLISSDSARALLQPVLARHLRGADLAIALDRELSFDDEYDRRPVLVVPDGTVLDGDLVLDHDTAKLDGTFCRGIVALGALHVAGNIVNANCDGGPFLVVLGGLHVRHILKGGAAMMIVGPVAAAGTIYCSYNHGSFRAWGGLTADGILIDDHLADIAGPIEAIRFVMGQDDAAAYLVGDLLYDDEDDPCGGGPVDDVSDLIRQRILAGEAVFRADAPRMRSVSN